jgi:hypothetical protein
MMQRVQESKNSSYFNLLTISKTPGSWTIADALNVGVTARILQVVNEPNRFQVIKYLTPDMPPFGIFAYVLLNPILQTQNDIMLALPSTRDR